MPNVSSKALNSLKFVPEPGGGPWLLSTSWVGRKSIFDRDRAVFGYELLFRALEGPTAAEAAGTLGDQMTADVMFNSVSIGIDRLVGDKKLFCNASRGVLTGVVPVLLPPDRTVVEVLEAVVPRAEALPGCRRLREEGFTLALDNVSVLANVERLIDLASFVKIDLRATDPEELPRLVDECQRHDVALVAKKVETEEDFSMCADMASTIFRVTCWRSPAAFRAGPWIPAGCRNCAWPRISSTPSAPSPNSRTSSAGIQS